MRTETDINEAEKLLIVKTSPSLLPELTTGENGDLYTHLRANRVAKVWEPSTKYFLGDEVVPTPDNQTGIKFRCLKTGMSGTTEPSWSSYSCSLIDEDTHRQPCGNAPEFLWSINGAAHDAWMQKAGIAVSLIGTTRGANTYNYEAIYLKCVEMANSYEEVFWK